MSLKCIPPWIPLVYRKTGVCRSIPIFFFILLQNIDCGYSLEPFKHVPRIYVLSKNKKNIKHFQLKNFQILNPPKKSLYIEWASFHNAPGTFDTIKLLIVGVSGNFPGMFSCYPLTFFLMVCLRCLGFIGGGGGGGGGSSSQKQL